VIKKKISKKDLKTWKDYLKDPRDIFDKDSSVKNIFQKNRFKFDLHGYSLIDANREIKKIILSCVENSYREILVITGKGMHSKTANNVFTSKDLNKLRYSVPDYIKTDDEISKYIKSISQAEPNDGGDGAILIKLKKL
tara:strand:- start:31 stop:444 length:414 start_codon:yes stop_codon:yes gene_type:complete